MSYASLRITFYESGIGETIVIEFPNDTIGVVDAHPAGRSGRGDILDIIGQRSVEFVCLTHPHADHGRDLIKIIHNSNVREFWHSLSPISLFVYYLEQYATFPSHLKHVATSESQTWAEFMLDLLNAVSQKGLTDRPFNESHKPIDISGVRLHFLAPSEAFANSENKRLIDALSRSSTEPLDPNDFSIIMAVEYGQSVVVLGSDAKHKAWRVAAESFRRAHLPKAVGLKIPHHGALNAFDLRPGDKHPLPINCWHLCRQAFDAVLFAGTTAHPNKKVHKALSKRPIRLHSLFHLEETIDDPNPLRIRFPEATVIRRKPRRPQYSSVTFVIPYDGDLEVTFKDAA